MREPLPFRVLMPKLSFNGLPFRLPNFEQC